MSWPKGQKINRMQPIEMRPKKHTWPDLAPSIPQSVPIVESLILDHGVR